MIGSDFDINTTNISDSMQMNVTSCLILTNMLMTYYDQSMLQTAKLFIINMSTIAAIKPYPSWSLYCTMKAAKEMFFNTLALEREQDNTFKILNYAPGPVDTNVSIGVYSVYSVHVYICVCMCIEM